MLELRLNSAEMSEPASGLQITKGGTVKEADSSIVSGEVIIPEGVKGIGSGAFSGNTRITKVIIPESCRKIGNGAFFGCTSLVEASLPDSITSIGESAFSYAPISKVNISPRCRYIGVAAFADSNLESVALPDSIVHLSDAIFSNCHKLKQVKLPKNLTVIGEASFYSCTSLEQIEIPSTVQKISRNAFDECTSLTTLNLPESLDTIDANAFVNCTALSNVNLPKTVQKIDFTSFRNTPWLSSWLDSIPEVDGMRIWGSSVLTGANCTGDVEIPEGITDISEYAFEDNRKIRSVSFPNSLEKLANDAFKGCSNIADILLPDRYFEISTRAFDKFPKLRTIRFSRSDPKFVRDFTKTYTSDVLISIRTALLAIFEEEYLGAELELNNPKENFILCSILEVAALRYPNNRSLISFVYKNLEKFLEIAETYGDTAFVNAVFSRNDISVEYVDLAITNANKNRNHTLVAKLMDYKAKVYGFRNIEDTAEDLL